MSDIWESAFGPQSMVSSADPDNDQFSNLQESLAGTDPRDAGSHPRLSMRGGTSAIELVWPAVAGKQYQLWSSSNLLAPAWTAANALHSAEAGMSLFTTSNDQPHLYFRLSIADADSDGDGLNNYEEILLGMNPGTRNSDRNETDDLERTVSKLSAPSIVSVSVIDPWLSERWPDPAVIVFRRTGGWAPLNVSFVLGGTADVGEDYLVNYTNTISFALAQREAYLLVHPVADNALESEESVTVSLLPDAQYALGTDQTAALILANETEASPPHAKEAARFLIQAAFGPDQDSIEDADDIPENVEELMAIGFDGWLNDEFARPIGKLQPFVEWAAPRANELELYGDLKQYAWWNRAMGVRKLRPDDSTEIAPDYLRQRVALALSEILVISDGPEDLAVVPDGMANYYDTLLTHAFGNYRDLLFDVAMHPCMGIYLSHVGNRKADPVARVYPDENFAREIMQLFSIGLWELNADGSRQLDSQGQPIATYDNDDITELARVFTGIGFGGSNVNFGIWPRNFLTPMKVWDEFHDCEPKSLLGGVQLPARAPSPGNAGLAGMADINAAIDVLFHHPNVGPFIGRQLIQRFITSNPSPAYVGRVAASFANNGSGVRGDMKAVIRAVLMDNEARDAASMDDPTFGKLREPFLRCVNFARAFNANAPSGIFPLDSFSLDHAQEPLKAPSVFNFFLPAHSPPGVITEAGLVAPEFQIINASTAVTAPNYFWNAIRGSLHRWGASNRTNAVQLNLEQEMSLVVPAEAAEQDMPSVAPYDPDALLRRLDLTLTGGRIAPEQFRIIRETLQRLPRPAWQWHHEYLRVAIYLVVTSPEFSVVR